MDWSHHLKRPNCHEISATAVSVACMLALLITCGAPALRADGECGAAQDFMVQAREKITPESSSSELGDGLQLLKHANSLCPELGDAWYYRSLFEKKLGHGPQADYALRQAKLFNSEAQAQGVDPFSLAAAASAAAAKNSNPPVGDKWALVLGIQQFKDARIPPLHFTGNDSEAWPRPSPRSRRDALRATTSSC